jgi:MoxR-like ATPase
VQALVEHTRRAPDFVAGLSPRAALSLVAVARGWALLAGRDHVMPEDIQAVLPGVAGHRLLPVLQNARRSSAEIGTGLIEAVPIP